MSMEINGDGLIFNCGKAKKHLVSQKKLRRKKKPSRFWCLEALREIVTIDESFTNFF